MAKINLGRVVGQGLDFKWAGTKLGVKRESDTEYIYIDLEGPKGEKGDPGEDAKFTKEEIIKELGYTPEDKENAKKEIARLENIIGSLNDLTTEDKTSIVNAINELMKNKATHQDILDEIDEYNIAVGIVTGDLTSKVLELNSKKADKDDVVTSVNGQKGDVVIESGGGDSIRTATFVIANYDSHENSKKGADLVLGEDDDVFDEIGKIMEDMADTGGVIQLMEGHYKTYVENGPFEGKDGIVIRGLGNATLITNIGNDFLNARHTNNISLKDMKLSTIKHGFLGWVMNSTCWENIIFDSGPVQLKGFINIKNSRFNKDSSITLRGDNTEGGPFIYNTIDGNTTNIINPNLIAAFNIIDGKPKVEGI